jgi:hypothetical protein
MAISIQISKKSAVFVPDIGSYRLVIETVNPQNISGKVFINQRVRNFAKDKFEDTFVAVCTPTQLEDLQEDSPDESTSYYRTNKIDLVARTPELLQTVFDSILFEVKKLVIDLSDLEKLTDAEVYLIDAYEPITLESP